MKTANYMFRDFYIPEHMMEGIRRYIDEGKRPGEFLTAVICNDLREACGRADDVNIRNLPAYVAYFYNEAPSPCWGSRDKMDGWIRLHYMKRNPEEKESNSYPFHYMRRNPEENAGG